MAYTIAHSARRICKGYGKELRSEAHREVSRIRSNRLGNRHAPHAERPAFAMRCHALGTGGAGTGTTTLDGISCRQRPNATGTAESTLARRYDHGHSVKAR